MQTTLHDQDFELWVPAIFAKAGDVDADAPRRLEGLASDEREDFDGEEVMQRGLDLSYLTSRGVVNWNHEPGPANVIGICVDAKLKPEGLWVSGDLFPRSAGVKQANDAWQLAQAMSHMPGSRRLGWSLQGQIQARDGDNPRKVTKAKVFHVALTHEPKNARTFALPALRKAILAADAELAKTLTVSAPEHRALALENLSGTMTSILWGDCAGRPDRCYDARMLFKAGWRGMQDHLRLCKGFRADEARDVVDVLRANFVPLETLAGQR